MQNNEYYAEQNDDKNTSNDEVDLGTFKSVKSLKDAYDCLRKTFTQNAMELAKFKKSEAVSEQSENDELDAKVSENDKKTQKNNKNSEKTSENNEFSSNSSDTIESDKVATTPDKNANSMDKATAPIDEKFNSDEWRETAQKFFLENPKAREHISEIGRIIMQDQSVKNSADPLDKAWIKVLNQLPRDNKISDTDLEQYILQNDEIKQKIINDYLKGLQVKKSAPKVIAERVGAQVNATKSSRALTMAEAKELAKKILIK